MLHVICIRIKTTLELKSTRTRQLVTDQINGTAMMFNPIENLSIYNKYVNELYSSLCRFIYVMVSEPGDSD